MLKYRGHASVSQEPRTSMQSAWCNPRPAAGKASVYKPFCKEIACTRFITLSSIRSRDRASMSLESWTLPQFAFVCAPGRPSSIADCHVFLNSTIVACPCFTPPPVIRSGLYTNRLASNCSHSFENVGNGSGKVRPKLVTAATGNALGT